MVIPVYPPWKRPAAPRDTCTTTQNVFSDQVPHDPGRRSSRATNASATPSQRVTVRLRSGMENGATSTGDQSVREEYFMMVPASLGASPLVLKALLLMASDVYPSRTPRSAHLDQCSTRKGNASRLFKPLVHHRQSTGTAVAFMANLHVKLGSSSQMTGAAR